MKHARKLLVALLGLSLMASGLVVAQSGLAASAGPDRTVNVGQQVGFDGSSSSGDIVSYNWAFGDGNTATGVTTTHTYAASGTYTVSLTVTDAQGNTATDTANLTVRTQDAVAPSISHTPTTSATAESAVTIRATVTDNVGVQSVTLFYQKASQIDQGYLSTTMSADGDSYTGTIPSSVTTETVHYYIRARDTSDNRATYPESAPRNGNNLTVSITDAAAPGITTTPPESATAGQSLTVTATITDNVGVDAATLYYRFGGGESSFTTVAMSGSDGTYSASVSVPSSGVTEVQYYLTAADAAGNTARAPTSGTAKVGVASASAPTLTHTPVTTATAGESITVRATVTAATGNTLQNVTLAYRAGGADAWNQVEMTAVGQTSTYTATIPAAAVTDAGVAYVINATDDQSNVRRSPATGLSAPHTVATPPAQPTGLQAERTAEEVRLTWTALESTENSSVATYKVYRSLSSESGFGTPLATVATNAYTDTAVADGRVYHYKVSAVDAHGAEGSQSDAAATTRGVVPTSPTPSLTAGDGQVAVSWAAAEDAAWYVLETSQDGATWTEVANATGASATVTGLTNGQQTWFRLAAYNAYDETNGPGAAAAATPTAPATNPGGNTGGGDNTGDGSNDPGTGAGDDGNDPGDGTGDDTGDDTGNPDDGTTGDPVDDVTDGTDPVDEDTETPSGDDDAETPDAGEDDGTETGDDGTDPTDDGSPVDDVTDDVDDATGDDGADDSDATDDENASDDNDDAETSGDTSSDDSGWGIPGFTGAFAAVALLGAAMVLRRR